MNFYPIQINDRNRNAPNLIIFQLNNENVSSKFNSNLIIN